jgi:hypothetical protein
MSKQAKNKVQLLYNFYNGALLISLLVETDGLGAPGQIALLLECPELILCLHNVVAENDSFLVHFV